MDTERPPKPAPRSCRYCGRPGLIRWRAREPPRWSNWHRYNVCDKGQKLLATYGITCADFYQMQADQLGTCILSWCDRPCVFVDHDHATGRIRGLTCAWHNSQVLAGIDEVIEHGALLEVLAYVGFDVSSLIT